MRHGEVMRYLPTTAAQRAEMLRTIGVGDVDAAGGRSLSRVGVRRGEAPALPAAFA